jgi:hypothetical protein
MKWPVKSGTSAEVIELSDCRLIHLSPTSGGPQLANRRNQLIRRHVGARGPCWLLRHDDERDVRVPTLYGRDGQPHHDHPLRNASRLRDGVSQPFRDARQRHHDACWPGAYAT